MQFINLFSYIVCRHPSHYVYINPLGDHYSFTPCASHSKSLIIIITKKLRKRVKRMTQEGRKRAIRKATTSNKNKRQKVENMDKISQMPNEILLMIMCLLPVDDVVRTCVLSKRWQNLWKQVPRLTLDVKHMIKPLKQLKISSPAKQLHYILNLPQEQGIYRYSILVYLILHHHEGDLKSLRFTHFPLQQLQTTLDFLFDRKKTIEALTLECRPLYTKKEKMRTQLFMGMCCSGLFAPLVSLQVVSHFFLSIKLFIYLYKLLCYL